MTFIASISSFYSDACITYATLSIGYFALSKNSPFSFEAALWKRVLFGVLAGLAALYLGQDRLIISGKLYYSFTMMPMILVMFYGGALSGAVCYLVNFAFTGGFTLDNLFIGSIILPLLLLKVWRKKSNHVFYLTIGIIALYRIAVVGWFLDLRNLWLDILLYQFAFALCLAICYHALRFKERHIHAFFSMRNKATTDSLTHINNRASVDYKMLLQHAQRQSCGLMILDLDDFKKVNDTYGHLAGDGVLASVGYILQDCVRQEDFVGRYGGEEFIVITSSYDPHHIATVAERIRSRVERSNFASTDGTTFQMTLSIGTSLYLPGMSVEKAIEMTDDALYDAKRGGKNRVVSSRLMSLAPLGEGFGR
ncbi:diguanylate cyclase [Serratia sp. L9]|uniref:GGDEF domain-containing protein n=1 Tax=Serratia sp. L9 TaxID=3423946 RepID=UPI003D6715BD